MSTASPSTTPDSRTNASLAPGLLWLNSTTAFVLAASVAVTLHESAHAVAGLAQGSPVVLYAFAANNVEPLSVTQTAIMAAAGPVFSLVFGLLVIATLGRAGRGFGRLFWTWLGFISTQNFLGYAIITPFGAGDSGKFIETLGLGTPVAIVFCLVGVAGYLVLAWAFLRRIVRYVDNAPDLRRIALFAWLAGTAVVVVRTLLEAVVSGPDVGTIPVVIAGAASVGIFVPIFTRAWQKVSDAVEHEQLTLTRPVVWIVVAIVVMVIEVAVLARGIPLG